MNVLDYFSKIGSKIIKTLALASICPDCTQSSFYFIYTPDLFHLSILAIFKTYDNFYSHILLLKFIICR